MSATDLKNKGNTYFQAGEFAPAVECFTQAIAIDKHNHILYSNRSAAFAGMGKYHEALEDANTCIQEKPDFSKGYGRKGAALHFLGRFAESIAAYKQGLAMDSSNSMLIDGLKQAEEEMEKRSSQSKNPMAEMGKIFQGDIWSKLNADPSTANFKNDPEFVKLIENIKQNPALLQQHLADKRVLAVFGVLLGINLKGAEGMEDEEFTPPPKREEPKKEQPKKEEPKKEEKPLSEADKEKEIGNEFYRNKKFEEAVQHYSKAIELEPKNPTFKSNRAAAYLEMGKFEECIAECEAAIADSRAAGQYQNLPKLLSRQGSAFAAQKNWDEAIKYFNRSLAEQRNPEVLKKLQSAEKEKKIAEESAYLSPEISAQEKALGNEKFKNGLFPEAMKHYNEAIKRNPKDHALYSNRSACYSKLLEFQLALKDAETCIEMAPDFVRGHARKAAAHFYLKEYHKALAAYEAGLKLDPSNAECQEGIQNVERQVAMHQTDEKPDEQQLRRAMADPEIQDILRDPIMSQVLNDMQQDPKSIGKHMKNAQIAKKIEKLIAAGVLRMG